MKFNPRLLTTLGVFALAFTLLAGSILAAKGTFSTALPLMMKSATAENTPPPPTATSAIGSNVWQGTVSLTDIPLGDGDVSTTPQVGYTFSCTMDFRSGGARHAGDWINDEAHSWNALKKVSVLGAVLWPDAMHAEVVTGDSRVLTTNGLPHDSPTGIFPIQRSDPTYQYDTNPNAIGVQNFSYSVPKNPVAAESPSCTPLGPIGVMNDGVILFNSLDDAGRDAVAHEIQDACDGHPNGREIYHYHNVAGCLIEKATGTSTLVGYALDGYGIYVERDANGNLPTNADLDACHGRTSPIMWDGAWISIYHYSTTYEYPYTVGCFHGTLIVGPGSR